MKQVPKENKKKVSSTRQMQILNSKLAGNEAFATCRGKLGCGVSHIADDFISATDSPSGFLNKWDDFFGKARVMTNLLAQLKRDGMNVAYEGLKNALTMERYLFPGETVPIEQTQPITLVVLEPTKTFTFLRWLLEEHWMTLRNHLDWIDKAQTPKYGGAAATTPLTQELYAAFPSLEEYARKFWDGYEGKELYAVCNDLWDTFPKEIHNALGKMGKIGNLLRPQWNDHIEDVDHIPLMYVCQAEQSKVLSLFSREDQARIATWQIDLPKVIPANYIGLHPQKHHSKWRKTHPARTSHGVSHGYGAMAFDMQPLREREGCIYPTASNSSGEAGKYGIVFTAMR